MKTQLRHLIAEAMYVVKSYNLPSVCERYGMESGSEQDAFTSKNRYVMKRLEKLSDEQALNLARQVVQDYPDDKLLAAIEQIDSEKCLVSDITRNHVATALNEFSLGGERDLDELLRKYWPKHEFPDSALGNFAKMVDGMNYAATLKSNRTNSEILKQVGFYQASQTKLFEFLADLIHPIRRSMADQEGIVARLNPILRRDGYCLIKQGAVSGYPTYKVIGIEAAAVQPADELNSQTLQSFDEGGVHTAWQKALDRRTSDPEGAITAAKTLLETVCKHIIEEAGGQYGPGDDLPKLYSMASEFLNLAPSQHSESVFKQILGNCHSVVSNLAGLRNKLGDSHGQGKRYVKPLPRHAELAVNLAGSSAMFLIATWNARQRKG